MLRTKLKMCFDYWKSLSDEEKETKTAKHLRAACEAGIMLGNKYDKERSDAIKLRLKYETRSNNS